MPKFLVPPDAPSLSAKEFLRRYAGVSLTLWRKIKRQNDFYLNGKTVQPSLAVVRPGDTIVYSIEQTTAVAPADLPLHIIYEDSGLLILNKPAGQLVHPTVREHENTLANAVLGYYRRASLTLNFHPVQRLDRNTSGIILIAKHPQFQHLLSLSPKNFHRLYLAFVTGVPRPLAGTVRAPIARRPGSIIERMVSPDGQDAVTHYQVLRANHSVSLVALRLETGRTHQIRVHMAHIGHPLLGDDLYGGARALIERQALHAARLRFTHPESGKSLRFTVPWPQDLDELYRKLFAK